MASVSSISFFTATSSVLTIDAADDSTAFELSINVKLHSNQNIPCSPAFDVPNKRFK